MQRPYVSLASRPPRRFDHTALAIALTGAIGWLIPLAWLFYYLTR